MVVIFTFTGPEHYVTGGFLVNVGQLKGKILNLIIQKGVGGIDVFQAIPLKVAGNSSLLKVMVLDENGDEISPIPTFRADFVCLIDDGQTPITTDKPVAPPTPPITIPEKITDFDGAFVPPNGDPAMIHLEWEPAGTGGSPIIGFKLYRDGDELGVVGPAIREFDDEDIVEGETYTYTILAYNAVGDGPLSDGVEVEYPVPHEWVEVGTITPSTLDVSISENGQYILVGSNGATNPTVKVSSDGGATWTPLPEVGIGNLYYGVYVTRTGQYMAVCETGSGYLWMSNNYGAPGSWVQNATLKGGAVGAFWACSRSDDGQTILVSEGSHYGEQSQAYVSHDGGLTWPDGTGGINYCYRCDMSSDGKYMVVAPGAGDNQLRLSTDFGATWTPIGPVDNYFDAGISNDGQKIIASSFDRTYLSIDGGLNFVDIGIGSPGDSVRACDMSKDGTIMLAAGGGLGNERVYLSTDGGATWNSQDPPGTHLFVAMDVNPNGEFALALDGIGFVLWEYQEVA